jgi:NADP-dependent 3-hydroxy acid dehydrogenase YdfG
MKEYVLITGATSGIGKATAIEFEKNKWNLILCGRRADRLEEIKSDFTLKYGVDILTISFDVRNKESVNLTLSEIPNKVKKSIKILVNNAGLAAGRSPIHLGEDEDWEQMIDTNIKGLLYVSKSIIPLFIKNKTGHIINISSIAGKENYPDGNVYCATKHASISCTIKPALEAPNATTNSSADASTHCPSN